MIIATHADVDHTQGLTRAREILKCVVAAHPKSIVAIEEGDEVLTYARIDAQGIRIPMPRCKVDREATFPRPEVCPQCGSADVHIRGDHRKTMVDLKLVRGGLKRWVTR